MPSPATRYQSMMSEGLGMIVARGGITEDQAVGPGVGVQHALVGQETVILGHQIGVPRLQIIRPGGEDQVHGPLGRPSHVVRHVFKRAARHREVVVHAVRTEHVQIGVRLVGGALAVAVHIDAIEAQRLHGVLAQAPNLVQVGAGTGEGGGIVIELRLQAASGRHCWW